MDDVNTKIADLILEEETKYLNKLHKGEKSVWQECIPMIHDDDNACYNYTNEYIRMERISKLRLLLINPWQDLSMWQGEAAKAVCELKFNNVSLTDASYFSLSHISIIFNEAVNTTFFLMPENNVKSLGIRILPVESMSKVLSPAVYDRIKSLFFFTNLLSLLT